MHASETIKKQHKSIAFGWFVCALGAIFYCYEYLLRISPSIMAADLMRAYHINAATFGHLVAFYYYIYTPMQLPVGILMDRYGPRRLLIIACLTCAVGTYLFTGINIQVLWVAEIGRFLIGLGSAFAFIGVLKLATIWLPPHRFALIAGLTTTLGMLGAMIGDITLAALVRAQGWQNTLLYSAIIGVILALIIGITLPETGDIPKNSKITLRDFQLLLSELIQLFKKPYIWLNGLIGCLLYLSLSTFAELWGAPYLETAFHYSHSESAAMISLVFLGWAIGGPIIGAISDRMKRRCSPLLICSIFTSLFFTLIVYGTGFQKSSISLLLFLVGVASSGEIIIFAIAREMSPSKLAATALAFTNMLVMFGGMVLQPTIGFLLNVKWKGQIVDYLHIYTESDYRFALTILPICSVIAIIAVFFMKETYAKPVEED